MLQCNGQDLYDAPQRQKIISSANRAFIPQDKSLNTRMYKEAETITTTILDAMMRRPPHHLPMCWIPALRGILYPECYLIMLNEGQIMGGPG